MQNNNLSLCLKKLFHNLCCYIKSLCYCYYCCCFVVICFCCCCLKFDSLIVSSRSLNVRRILRAGRLGRLFVLRLFVAADSNSAKEDRPASASVFLAGEISIETSDAGHGQGSTAARSATCRHVHRDQQGRTREERLTNNQDQLGSQVWVTHYLKLIQLPFPKESNWEIRLLCKSFTCKWFGLGTVQQQI